jgi:hypothetical protein
MQICFMCEMLKYGPEKYGDRAFLLERKGEFFPDNEFGDMVDLCDEHFLGPKAILAKKECE